jgi:hypothetical protein
MLNRRGRSSILVAFLVYGVVVDIPICQSLLRTFTLSRPMAAHVIPTTTTTRTRTFDNSFRDFSILSSIQHSQLLFYTRHKRRIRQWQQRIHHVSSSQAQLLSLTRLSARSRTDNDDDDDKDNSSSSSSTYTTTTTPVPTAAAVTVGNKEIDMEYIQIELTKYLQLRDDMGADEIAKGYVLLIFVCSESSG